jgi:hypothetical protein
LLVFFIGKYSGEIANAGMQQAVSALTAEKICYAGIPIELLAVICGLGFLLDVNEK